jgi:hypothetical protein
VTDVDLRAEIRRTGRWSWSIGIYNGDDKWGPVHFIGFGPTDFNAYGTRRMAEARARRLMRKWRRIAARDGEHITITEDKPPAA